MKRILIIASAAMMAAIGAWAQSGVSVSTEDELHNAISTYPNGGIVELSANITLQSHVAITSGSITLDLNGHTLKRNLSEASDLGNVIRVSNGATLTIKDSSSDNSGQITGGRATNGGGICNHGTLWLYGGTIASNYASGCGGGVYNAPSTVGGNPATFYMMGGVILGNWGGDAGGIYNYSGSSVGINSGAISGNTSNAGGGGLVNYGEAVVSNGVSLNNNHATTRGGGIWNGGTLTVNAATVSSNRADTEGGGIWNQGTLNINDAVNITGNTKGSGWNSNLFCTSGHTVSITGNLGNASIGVSCEGNNGVVTSGLGSNGSIDNFFSDIPELATLETTDNSEAKLTKRTDVIHYVERSWDAANQKVVETIRTVDASRCTFLDETNSDREYSTTTNESYLVVRNTNVAYKWIRLNDDCSLILCDGASINLGKYFNAGQNELKVYGQINDSGRLTGPINVPWSLGSLEIHGGIIEANNPDYAGIGSGEDQECGFISIYGGTVNAKGGKYAAGIGGGVYSSGHYCDGGIIKIFGGNVKATGGDYGAGIGGGYYGDGGTITISGGHVEAHGGVDAAGIGSGEEHSLSPSNIDGGTITITGGFVEAWGNGKGAGIGGGQMAASGKITINGGTVIAHGGEDSMAICGHDDSDGVNSIVIGDDMMVSNGGQTFPVHSLGGLIDGRAVAVANNHDVIVQPCSHSGSSTDIIDAHLHRVGCSYCLIGNSNVAHTFDNYGECAACGLVCLGDNADNVNTIKHWNGKTKTVVLSGRTLYKDGNWNTLCLPFSLPIAGSLLDGDGVVVQTLDKSLFNDGALTLDFTPVSTIEAGKPYLIKWNKVDTHIVNPVFTNVGISNTTSNVTSDYIDFIGTYSPQVIYQDSNEKTNLYLASSNKLNYPKTEGYAVNAFRAYFTLKGGLTVGNMTSGNVRSFMLNFGDSEASGIENAETNSSLFTLHPSLSSWYSLDGRRLGGKPTAKGIFLHNGRKVVIK